MVVERRNSALGNGRILWFESDGGLMAFSLVYPTV